MFILALSMFLILASSIIHYHWKQWLTNDAGGGEKGLALSVGNDTHDDKEEEDVVMTYHLNPSKRTEAHVNKQLISTLFKGLDPFSGLSYDAKPDWSYPHTNFVPNVFEYMWTKYIKPNHDELTFYLEVGSFKAGSVTRLAELLKSKYANWQNTSIVCVDTFSGDVNMWAWNNEEKWGHDFLATGLDGRPRIFDMSWTRAIKT